MKIALLADAHANLVSLEAVLRDIDEKNIDRIIFAGDAVGYYPYVNEVCTLLREKASWCVKGNHDAFVTGRLSVPEAHRKAYAVDFTVGEISPENMNWLRALPETLEIGIANRTFRVFHGSPWNPLEEYIYPDYGSFDRFDNIEADFVILGHTHYPMVRKTGNKTIINPGSCGQPRDYNPLASYAVLDTDSGEVIINRVSYDCLKVINKLNEFGFDDMAKNILIRTK